VRLAKHRTSVRWLGRLHGSAPGPIGVIIGRNAVPRL
jgi:hypothetical protein